MGVRALFKWPVPFHVYDDINWRARVYAFITHEIIVKYTCLKCYHDYLEWVWYDMAYGMIVMGLVFWYMYYSVIYSIFVLYRYMQNAVSKVEDKLKNILIDKNLSIWHPRYVWHAFFFNCIRRLKWEPSIPDAQLAV